MLKSDRSFARVHAAHLVPEASPCGHVAERLDALVRVHAELDRIIQVVVKQAAQHQVVRALLGVRPCGVVDELMSSGESMRQSGPGSLHATVELHAPRAKMLQSVLLA